MKTNTLVSVLVLGLVSTAGCAASEYEHSSLPDQPRTAARLDLTTDVDGAQPSFPARLTTPYTPAAVDHLAPRVVAELDGHARTDVRLCVGGDGKVADVALAHSSGIEELDAALMAEARTWRYQPLAATSATVCQPVQISYTVR